MMLAKLKKAAAPQAKKVAPAAKSDPWLVVGQAQLDSATDSLLKLVTRFQKAEAAELIMDVEILQKLAHGIERSAARVVNQCHYMEGVGQ